MKNIKYFGTKHRKGLETRLAEKREKDDAILDEIKLEDWRALLESIPLDLSDRFDDDVRMAVDELIEDYAQKEGKEGFTTKDYFKNIFGPWSRSLVKQDASERVERFIRDNFRHKDFKRIRRLGDYLASYSEIDYSHAEMGALMFGTPICFITCLGLVGLIGYENLERLGNMGYEVLKKIILSSVVVLPLIVPFMPSIIGYFTQPHKYLREKLNATFKAEAEGYYKSHFLAVEKKVEEAYERIKERIKDLEDREKGYEVKDRQSDVGGGKEDGETRLRGGNERNEVH